MLWMAFIGSSLTKIKVFLKNPRLAMMVRVSEKMNKEKNKNF